MAVHTVRDVHALGELLVAWLRELPEAVLPPSYWQALAVLLRRLQVQTSLGNTQPSRRHRYAELCVVSSSRACLIAWLSA